jgi:hypothetical protein
VKAITCILKQEAQRKQWCLINFSTRPPRGGNTIAIRVQTLSSVQLYDPEKSQ